MFFSNLTKQFLKPSASPVTEGLVDLSHHNKDFNIENEVHQHGLIGIIHKATQNTGFLDPQYHQRSVEAARLGVLWGAYHFASNADPESQVNFFLQQITNAPQPVLPCIDWEPNPTRGQETMTLDNLIKFITIFQKKTGVWPTIYGGYWMIDQLKGKKEPILKNCPLWQGYYKPNIQIPDTWNTWSIWQYSDGSTGPHPRHIDLNRFNGDNAQLQDFWHAHSIQPLSTWSFLKPGDVIDVIAPSSPPSNPDKTIKAIMNYFSTQQIKVNIPNDLISPTPVLNEANTIENRIASIKKALTSTQSKAVWAIMGGGWGTELLDKLQAELPKNLPVKPILGYSDVTALHIFFNQYMNWPTIHSIELGANGDIEPAWNQSKIADTMDVLTGKTPDVTYEATLLNPTCPFKTPMTSQIIGGNSLLMNALNGSYNFTLQTHKKVLFFESIARGPGEMSRVLNGFRYSPLVQNASAIILGNFVVTGGKPNTALEEKQFDLIRQYFADHLSIPVMHTAIFGHGPVNNPLPLNTKAIFEMISSRTVRFKVSANQRI